MREVSNDHAARWLGRLADLRVRVEYGLSVREMMNPVCETGGHLWYGNAGIRESYYCIRCGLRGIDEKKFPSE
jgi:hypothetical protein